MPHTHVRDAWPPLRHTMSFTVVSHDNNVYDREANKQTSKKRAKRKDTPFLMELNTAEKHTYIKQAGEQKASKRKDAPLLWAMNYYNSLWRNKKKRHTFLSASRSPCPTPPPSTCLSRCNITKGVRRVHFTAAAAAADWPQPRALPHVPWNPSSSLSIAAQDSTGKA